MVTVSYLMGRGASAVPDLAKFWGTAEVSWQDSCCARQHGLLEQSWCVCRPVHLEARRDKIWEREGEAKFAASFF